MKGAYTNAIEKLAYIRHRLQTGQTVSIPVVLAIAEALQKMIEILDELLADPKLITPEAISALRQLIEVRIMPLNESAPATGLGNPGTENA